MLQRYTELSDVQTFIDQLNSQKDYQLQENDESSLQQQLDMHLYKTITMMKQDSSKKMQPFYDHYIEFMDATVLKNALKQFIKTQEINEDLIKSAHSPEIKQQIKILHSTEPDELKTVLKQLQYPDSFISQITEIDDETHIGMAIDSAVDQIFIKRLSQTKMPYKCDAATQLYLKRMIDIRTIKHLIRAKQLSLSTDDCTQLLIDDGYELPLWKQEQLCQTENNTDLISALEGTSYYQVLKTIDEQNESSTQTYTDILDQFWLHQVKDIAVAHYSSIGPTFRFLENKKQEIRNLKIISKGIAEQLPSSLIKPLLIKEASM